MTPALLPFGYVCVRADRPRRSTLETYHGLSVWGRFNLSARDEKEGQSAVHLLLDERTLKKKNTHHEIIIHPSAHATTVKTKLE